MFMIMISYPFLMKENCIVFLTLTVTAAPPLQTNGYIFVRIQGGFHEIRNSVSFHVQSVNWFGDYVYSIYKRYEVFS